MKTKNDNQALHLRLRVLHAIDYPEIAEKFRKEHLEVLTYFGVNSLITSAENEWWSHVGCYLFIIQDQRTEELLGGMRIDVSSESYSMPVEHVVNSLTEHTTLFNHSGKQIVAEMCGLWVSRMARKIKLSEHLCQAGVIVSSKLGVQTLFTFPNQQSLPIVETLGFKVVNEIGNCGRINYPNENYVSTLVQLRDTSLLHDIKQDERNRILQLRSNPVGTSYYEVNGLKTHLEYDLRIA